MTDESQLNGMIPTELGGLTNITDLILCKIENVLCHSLILVVNG
jgi:hypothetical protein